MYDCLGANTPNPGIRSGDRGDEKENVYREEGLCLQMVLENDFRFGLQCQRILSRLAVCLKHHAALRFLGRITLDGSLCQTIELFISLTRRP